MSAWKFRWKLIFFFTLKAAVDKDNIVCMWSNQYHIYVNFLFQTDIHFLIYPQWRQVLSFFMCPGLEKSNFKISDAIPQTVLKQTLFVLHKALKNII